MSKCDSVIGNDQRSMMNNNFFGILRTTNVATDNITFINSNQGVAINVGIFGASNLNQGVHAIAIGSNAGFLNQGTDAIALGSESGSRNQGEKFLK